MVNRLLCYTFNITTKKTLMEFVSIGGFFIYSFLLPHLLFLLQKVLNIGDGAH